MERASIDQALPNFSDRRAAFDQLSGLLNWFIEDLPELPIGPSMSDAERKLWLRRFDFSQAVPLDELTAEVVDGLTRGTILSGHPRYWGMFSSTPTFPSIISDLISGAINPQLAVTSHAPLAVDIEAHVIRAITDRLGYDAAASGHFTSGGAEANMTAFLLALTASEPAYAEGGIRAFSGQPTLYASADSHFAWFKIAHQSGIGRDAVRLIPTDGSGRMDVAELRSQIAADRAGGFRPVMIVATAGTTNAGMVDPIEACVRIAKEEDLWLHIDAAWGGALIASARHRRHLDTVHLADSVTIDAHKWFSVTMGAGMLLTRRADMLARTFAITTSYMPAGEATTDPYTHSMQWSRRLVGLRLFMSLAALGWDGYGRLIEHHLDLAALLRERLLANGWRVEGNSPVGVVCFTDATKAASPEAIVQTLQNRQRAWVSVAQFEGHSVIRACATSHRATSEDVDFLVAELGTVRSASKARNSINPPSPRPIRPEPLSEAQADAT